ncbi:hypothetical protein [Brevibacillus sp. NRS-1366]
MVKEIKWTKILNYIGAILAFCIGAGFPQGRKSHNSLYHMDIWVLQIF